MSHRPAAGSPKSAVSPLSYSPWQSVSLRLVIVVVAPLLFLLVLELVLRIFGYGYSTSFFVRLPGQEAYTTNPKFGWRFSPKEVATQPYPVIIPAHKAPDSKRVFILGESAAQGTPVPAFGFSRILEVMLAQEYPDSRLEIYNVAMRGINSHAIVPIARECVQHGPDVFIIYMGNNETIGLHAPKPGGLGVSPPLWLLRLSQGVKDTRLGQLVTECVRSISKQGSRRPEQDMDFFRKYRLAADHPRKQPVYNNFHANLAEILQITTNSGAKVLLCTVAGNLIDFPPLSSLHAAKLNEANLGRWDGFYQQGVTAEAAQRYAEAITNYLAAAQLDDHFAELHFRLGRCHWALGQRQEARQHFIWARDWDALQFRTDSRLNNIIRELAGPMQVDVEEVFAQQAFTANAASSPRLFHEHVHLTFDGDYLLAQTLLPKVASTLGLASKGPGAQALPSRQECAEALAFTEWDEINVGVVAAKLTSKPPFLDQLEHAQRQAQLEGMLQARNKAFQAQGGMSRTVEIYRRAVARRPNDWQVRMNFGMLLSGLGDVNGAANEFSVAVQAMPAFVQLRALLSHSLYKAGKRGEAIAQLQEALKIDPENKSAKDGLEALTM